MPNETFEDLAHDPGRLHYRVHNIYLNFAKTYSRSPSASSVTLYQKSLLILWITATVAWLFIQLIKLRSVWCQGKSKDTSELYKDEKDDSETPLYGNYLNERSFTSKGRGQNKTTAQHNCLQETLEVLNETEEDDNEKDKKSYFRKVVDKLVEIYHSHDKDQPTFEQFLLKTTIFGGFMFYFWICDGLRLWPKVDKQYSRDTFIFLFFLLVFVAFVYTIRKTKDKLLIRDQTEEWKGWMQVQFVWYHYFDAAEVYNSIRVYVGAYVWMTGFGNYIYFSTRKDYSIFRLLKMLFRLNFLVLCVMSVTDHNFVRYYICAMHTYWFLSVWVVMVVLNRYNKHESFIIFKFTVYFIFNAIIFNVPGVFEKVFTPFLWVLKDDLGTLAYWKKRSTCDHWSTLVGMIVAFNFERYERLLKYLDEDNPKTRKKRELLRYAITATLLAALILWVYFIMRKPKTEYLELHPFLSPIPICIYTWLRNMHPTLRIYHLNLFTWLGKITLETYLSQIHIYMTDSAQRILVYLPQYPLLNFTLATLIYIAVSYQLFHLTVFFSSFLLPRDGDVVIKNIFLVILCLLLCYSLAYILTTKSIWTTSLSALEFLKWKIVEY